MGVRMTNPESWWSKNTIKCLFIGGPSGGMSNSLIVCVGRKSFVVLGSGKKSSALKTYITVENIKILAIKPMIGIIINISVIINTPHAILPLEAPEHTGREL